MVGKGDSDSSRLSPNIGDRVVVPWGLDEIEGIVVNKYGSLLSERVVVSIALSEVDETEEVVFPVDAVRLISTESIRSAGTWRSQASYLRNFADAFRRAVPNADIELEPLSSSGRRADMIATLKSGQRLLIETKTSGSARSSAVRLAVAQLNAYLQLESDRSYGLVVTSFELPGTVIRKYAPLAASGNIWVTFWRGREDDSRLKSLLGEMVKSRNLANLNARDRAVVPNASGGWDVITPERNTVSYHSTTQRAAVEKARELALQSGGEVVIQERSGAVRRRSQRKD
jgi:primosomal protein N'